jgi:hypothetical protein
MGVYRNISIMHMMQRGPAYGLLICWCHVEMWTRNLDFQSVSAPLDPVSVTSQLGKQALTYVNSENMNNLKLLGSMICYYPCYIYIFQLWDFF